VPAPRASRAAGGGGCRAQHATPLGPAFACAPDQFPELIAAAIERRDIATWAAKQDINTSRAA
jgi:hypothetical protein